MDFPIYGRTKGGDLVKIHAKDEHLVIINNQDKDKDDKITCDNCHLIYSKFEGTSQYLSAHLNGDLEEISEEEFNTELENAKGYIS